MNENILQDLRSTFLERTSLRNLPEAVWDKLSTLNTYGTNAIEGNTLTLEEVDTVLVKGKTVPGRPVRDLMETVQHRQAFRSLLLRMDRPIDMIYVLELHEEVFHGILADAGQWRRVNVTITGAKHSPPRLEKVIPMMERWCQELDRTDREGMETLEWVGRAHSSFESIHPFSDGNGRVGRLLMNLQLLKRNWPPISIMPRDREHYIEALERADVGDLRPMHGLLSRLLARSLVEMLDQVGTEKDRLVPLSELEKRSGKSAKYLSLRVAQGELPAVKVGKGYQSSERAWELYEKYVAYH